MESYELQAGKGQLIVVYVSGDDGEMVDPGAIWSEVANDADRRSEQGWRIVSTAVSPMRQMGTAGNILFRSGGQYATQIAVTVVYARS